MIVSRCSSKVYYGAETKNGRGGGSCCFLTFSTFRAPTTAANPYFGLLNKGITNNTRGTHIQTLKTLLTYLLNFQSAAATDGGQARASGETTKKNHRYNPSQNLKKCSSYTPDYDGSNKVV